MAPTYANNVTRCEPGAAQSPVKAQPCWDLERCMGHDAPSLCAIRQASPGSGFGGSDS